MFKKAINKKHYTQIKSSLQAAHVSNNQVHKFEVDLLIVIIVLRLVKKINVIEKALSIGYLDSKKKEN